MQFDKVYNIDFLDNSLPNKCAKLIIADPPYYRTKGTFDFIWKTMDEYLIDVEKWAVECKRILADNGTLFWWGHAKKIAYSQMILDKYFNLENVIKWRKLDCQTLKGIDGYRSFAPITEHVLMYSLDSLNITECIFYIRDYIRAEISKSKGQIVFKDINTAFGTATNGGGVASACLSLDKEEPAMITPEMYKKLQVWCSPYLRKEYEDLRKEYEGKRRPFDNYLKLTDVWDFAQESNISKDYAHETQKTESISRVMINTCSKVGDLVIVPFAGSGTEVSMAIKEGRKAIAFDIEQTYVDMSNNRIGKILQKPQLF